MLSRSREILTHHRSSLSDIEKTIVQWQPKQSANPDAPEPLLF
jgi:hypothetical protein